ncbi:MAG: hypothetical protein KFF73_15145 [Cyclobacteriaceae bacterium]|nr:hypothetical protein [Cyclobacteriaceae bacterium]
MALVNNPSPTSNHWKKLDKAAAFGEFFESTLSSSFENSLVEVDINKENFPLNLTVNKGFQINNRLIDVGLVYHVKINDKFSNRLALRKMLDVLTENYTHIRREAMQEKNTGDFTSLEEQGVVFNDYEKFNYVSKIITQNDDAWILILTFNDRSKDIVKNLLDLFWIEKEKGVIS